MEEIVKCNNCRMLFEDTAEWIIIRGSYETDWASICIGQNIEAAERFDFCSPYCLITWVDKRIKERKK